MKNIEAQAIALEQIRNVTLSFETLQAFVARFTEDLGGFRPLQQCIDTVVRLNTCGRCTDIRPPFCENVCAAIAAACYSPFNDALFSQLNQLWEATRMLVNTTQSSIAELNANKGLIINQTLIVSQIART